MEYRNGFGATTPTSAAERAARQDHVDLALRRTPGATVRGRRGVFPCGFPHLVWDLFYTSPTVIESTAGGAASVAAAQAAGRGRPGGGAAVRDLRVLTRQFRRGYSNPAHEMRCFRFAPRICYKSHEYVPRNLVFMLSAHPTI